MGWEIVQALASSTTTTTNTQSASLAATAVGDLVILTAAGRDHDPSTVSFSDPSGWTSLGSTLKHGPSGGTSRPSVVLRSWSRVMDGTESDPSVTRSYTGSPSPQWGLTVTILRSSDGDSPTITNVWDDTMGSTTADFYQPPSVSALRCSLLLQFVIGQADVSGSESFPGAGGEANDWTVAPLRTGWSFGPPIGVVTTITARGDITCPNYQLPRTSSTALSRTISVTQPGGCGNYGWKVGTL